MHRTTRTLFTVLTALTCFGAAGSYASSGPEPSAIKASVDTAILPLLENYAIPGMAVAVTLDGRDYFYNYGVASKETGQAVTSTTLFEIGSLSKTLTATLASYAQVNGQLSWSDSVSQHLPALRGSPFDGISLMNLGTHTAGDFPLQLPDAVTNNDQLMDYYRNWKPSHVPGTYRTYSNPGIGLLGVVTATSMKMPFAEAMEKTLLPQLGMTHTYINVPASQRELYAQGYNKAGAPVRLNPAVLADEAYGVKTNAVDVLRFVRANMGLVTLDAKVQRAVIATHTGYFKAGAITQDLIWEQYPDTAPLQRLLDGNADGMVYQGSVVTPLTPPLPPQADVLLNKTGSTGGFGAYVLYAPAKKIGIVMLANRNYPNAERVTAAFHLLTELERLKAARR